MAKKIPLTNSIVLTHDQTHVIGYVNQLSKNSYYWVYHGPVPIELYIASMEINAKEYKKTLPKRAFGREQRSSTAISKITLNHGIEVAKKAREHLKEKQAENTSVREDGRTVVHLKADDLELPNPALQP